MTDGKTENKALELAMKLSIDEIESAQLEDAIARQKTAPPVVKENSYEKIMQVFGGKLVT